MAGKLARILILEHAPTDAELIELQLQKAKINFASKRVGTKELFLATYPDFDPDLVIANYSLPRFDVLAALTQAQSAQRRIPWVILSGANNEEVAVSCMKAGAVDYVPKRNITRLGLAVKNSLEKSAAGEASDGDVKKKEEKQEEKEEVLDDRHLEAEAREDFFRLVVEGIHDLIAVLNLDGKRIYNNPAYEDLLEEPDVLRGTDSFLDVHPDDREMIRRLFHESLRTGVGKRAEYRMVDQFGNAHTMDSQGAVMKDEEGRSTGIVVVSRDITERKEAETGFQNLVAGTSAAMGDEFFSALVRHLARALQVRYALVSECVSKTRERVRSLAYWANETWLPGFEYDVAGTTCERVMLEGKMCFYPDHVQQLFPNENALAAMKAVCYLGIPLFNPSGDVIGHMFVMDDKPLPDFSRAKYIMSVFAARAASELERQQQIDSLRKAEGDSRSILESLGIALVVTDAGGVITYVNPRMAGLSGFRVGELIGKPAPSLLLPKKEWEDLQRRILERRKGGSEEFETSLARKDGTSFRARLDGVPYRDSNGEIAGTLAMVTPLDHIAEPESGEPLVSADL